MILKAFKSKVFYKLHRKRVERWVNWMIAKILTLFAFKSKMVLGTSLVAQMVKNLPAVQETWVFPLDLEDHLEKEKATHSSILVWKTPWMEELDRLCGPRGCKGWLHFLEDYYRRRKWQPTPVFLPGKSHGCRNLVGYNPWGHKESSTI